MNGLDTKRIKISVDHEIIKNTRIVVNGAGTSAAACEALARFGVGEIWVIDNDTVGEENRVRQHYYHDQVGMKKVDALGENLRRINPNIKYHGIPKMTDVLSKQEQLKIYSNASVILNMTDSFKAQIFGAEQCQRWEVPGVWSGYYEKSRAFEVVFYIPGQTSCYCCAVQSRLKTQEAAKDEIQVPSDGNTSAHAMIGDGVVVMLVIALLHNNSKGYEFSNWLGSDWYEYNLLQTKLHPAYSSHKDSLFERNFGHLESGSSMPFQTLWRRTAIHETPMYEKCPVCAKIETEKNPRKIFKNQKT